MRILVTRATADMAPTLSRLSAMGHTPIAAPLFVIEAQPYLIPRNNYTAIITTSAHAFDFVADDVFTHYGALPFFCVGAKTAQAIYRRYQAAHIIQRDTAAQLITEIQKHSEHGSYLYLTTQFRKKDIEAELGAQLTIVETYHSRAINALSTETIDLIKTKQIDCILHYSQRSAALLIDLAHKADLGTALKNILHIAISADAAIPLIGLPYKIAATPHEQAMFDVLHQANIT